MIFIFNIPLKQFKKGLLSLNCSIVVWEGGLAWYDTWLGAKWSGVQFPPLPLL